MSTDQTVNTADQTALSRKHFTSVRFWIAISVVLGIASASLYLCQEMVYEAFVSVIKERK